MATSERGGSAGWEVEGRFEERTPDGMLNDLLELCFSLLIADKVSLVPITIVKL